MTHRSPILIVDPNGCVEHASKGAADLLRAPADSLVGAPLSQWLAAPPGCPCESLVAELLQDGPRAHPAVRQAGPEEAIPETLWTYAEPLAGQQRRWLVTLHHSPQRPSDPEGPPGVLVGVQDPTEVDRLHRSWSQERAFWEDLLIHAPDALCIANTHTLLLKNRRFVDLFGDLETLDELNDRVQAPGGRSLEWFALARTEPDWLEPIECTTDDGGEPKELSVFIRPIVYAGEPTFFFALRDISDLRRLERQLLRSQKLGALGKVAAGTCHDFGNLLTLLAFDVERARSLTQDPSMASLLGDMIHTTDRALQLARGLTRFTQAPCCSDARVDLADTILALQPVLERSMGSGRSLVFDVAEGPLIAALEATQIEQIVLNLILNARDATGDGDTIQVSLRQPDLTSAEIHVRDSGTGMTREVKERAFDPFFTTKRANEGAGLGLSVVQDVVKRAGGAIRVDSELGYGTHIVVRLPISDTPEEEGEFGAPAHGDETVALCLSDEKLREAMARSLRLLGYRVIEYPWSALERAHVLPPAADAWIVSVTQLDILAALARAEAVSKPLPVVITCPAQNHPHPLPESEGLRLTSLSKPFTPLELARALRSVLA